MHRNTVRLALAGIAIFYAVFGGLWATNYFPLQDHYRQHQIMRDLAASSSGIEYFKSPAYRKANGAVEEYVFTHPDISVTESRIGLFQAILLWGTVALGVGGAVLFLTRGRRAS